MTATELDLSRTEAFAGRMVGVLNDAFLALSVSVGHQTGLFDAMAGLPPSTSSAIAEAAGLDERYVRELLPRPRPTRCRPSTRRCSPGPPGPTTWPRSRSSSRSSGRWSRTS
jgi:hypothetical protein